MTRRRCRPGDERAPIQPKDEYSSPEMHEAYGASVLECKSRQRPRRQARTLEWLPPLAEFLNFPPMSFLEAESQGMADWLIDRLDEELV